MVLRLVALFLPLTVWGAAPCNPGKSVLSCQNFPLQELPAFYGGEFLLRLDNVTGDGSWNVTGMEAVNTIIGSRMKLNQDALKSLLSLPHLSTLELTNSSIEITDASTIFTSEKLRTLRLIASLPLTVDYFNFTFLSELDLSGNKLVTIPKIDGEKIVYLNLSSTGIRKVENLDSLHSLEELDISNNGLRSVDKNAFVSNIALEKLWLQQNNLRNMAFNASNLRILNLNYNDLQTLNGQFFAGVPEVTNLNLVGNSILELIEPFKYLPHLKVIDLSDNEIAVLNGSWFAHVPELEVFRISHNNLLELPSLNASLHSLHHLNLSNNAIQALNGDFFKKTSSLAVLDVTHNQLKFIDAATPYLRSINKLHAAYNFLQITDKTFAKADMLNFLNVSHNQINIAANVFDKTPSLREIDLSYNDIDDFCSDGKAPRYIQELDIRFNKMRSLKCLTGLQSLDVEGNPLTCDLPSSPPAHSSIPAPALDPASDTILGNSSTRAPDTLLSESDDGDWQEVYNKLCASGNAPEALVVNSVADVSPPIMHDIPEASSRIGSEDDDDDDDDENDDDSDSDDDDEDDDDYEYITDLKTKTQSQKEGIHRVDHKIKDMQNAEPLATWAFALLGVCLVLLLINLLMFVWFRRRERKEARLGSDRPYEQLHNEVYKNTTTRLEQIHRPADIKNYFSSIKRDKLNHIVVKLGLRNQPSNDNESQARMIPAEVPVHQIA